MDREFDRPDYDPDDQGDYEKNLVLVVAAFSAGETSELYACIADECKKLRLKTCRIDKGVGSGLIIREVTEAIERAEFIIFDLTHNMPSVYYELGYAHGVGNEASEILLIAREGTVPHFELAPFRMHPYSSTEQLRSIVSSNLKAMIKATRR